MKIKPSSMYECLHLDPNYMALTVQNLMTISESFHLLDIHKDELLNDLQTKMWMQHSTNMKYSRIVSIFELLDCNSTGFFDFDMYYFFTAIMLCIKDKKEKEFINRHSRSLYNLFEVRMKGKMTHDQFGMVGWLFGFNKKIMKLFHKEFDISAYKRTVVEEFKFYVLICIELQKMIDKSERVRAYKRYRKRLIRRLKPKLVNYWKYDLEPIPDSICRDVRWTQRPYLRNGKNVRRLNIFKRFRKYSIRKFRIYSENHPGMCTCVEQCCQKFWKRRSKTTTVDIQHQAKPTSRQSKKLCLCFSRRKSRRVAWGEDNQIVSDEARHEDVSEASRMPSWIEHLDAIKKAKHKSSKKNLLEVFGLKKNPQVSQEDVPFIEEKKQAEKKKHRHHRKHQVKQGNKATLEQQPGVPEDKQPLEPEPLSGEKD